MEKSQNFQIPTAPLKLSSFNCSFEIEAFLNIGTKSGLTGGVRLTEFLGIFFGWFQLSFKNKSMVPDGFATKVGGFGWFRLVSGCFGWFQLVSGCYMFCFVPFKSKYRENKQGKREEINIRQGIWFVFKIFWKQVKLIFLYFYFLNFKLPGFFCYSTKVLFKSQGSYTSLFVRKIVKVYKKPCRGNHKRELWQFKRSTFKKRIHN